MSIPNRVEKLRFIISEMQLALMLAKHAPDDFIARALARHILVRAENYIEHVRRLRNVLNAAGFNTHDFHTRKEIYARSFEEYFKTVRHKLSAHVQDIDFGKRIELWNDVEINKTGYFVDGAKEIYESLATLGIPGYVPYAAPADLTDPALLAILKSYQGSADNRIRAEIGVDPLAMTRSNTVAMMVTGDAQQRAGQLVLIRRWIRSQREFMAQVEGYLNVVRILKARIITDIVSFYDGLVTRRVAPGALQEMDGLDTLLSAAGQDASAIGKFVTESTFDTALQAARQVRDHGGAHLEIDEALTLADLIKEIDGFDLPDALAFFERVTQLFTKVCHEVLFLRMYAVDGQRLYGVTPNAFRITPFDDRKLSSPTAVPPTIPRYDDGELYREALNSWLRGDDVERQNARQYFWNAFLHSATAEEITEEEALGGGTRFHRHHLRTAHQFMIDALGSGQLDSVLGEALELLLSCRSGDPYSLAEILIRWDGPIAQRNERTICYCLGETARWPHQTVKDYLLGRARGALDWNVRFNALLALFKIFVRSEGPNRINNKRVGMSYATDIEPLLVDLPDIRKLLCTIAFASQFCGYAFAHYLQPPRPLADDYKALQAAIETLCKAVLAPELYGPVVHLIRPLLASCDYVGLCLLISDQLTVGGLGTMGDDFLTAACGTWVVTAPHNGAVRHLVGCFLRKGQLAHALEVAERLANRNPDDIQLQILTAQILGEMPGRKEDTARRVAAIRSSYKLTADQEKTLSNLDA